MTEVSMLLTRPKIDGQRRKPCSSQPMEGNGCSGNRNSIPNRYAPIPSPDNTA